MDDWCTYTWTDLSPDGPIHLCHERNAAGPHAHVCNCGTTFVLEEQ